MGLVKKFSKGFFLILCFLCLSLNSPSQASMNFLIQNPGSFASELSSLNSNSLDPATNNDQQGRGFIQLMYEGLYQYTDNSVSSIIPSLAMDYNVSSDGLTYNFTIRTGVTFALQPGEKTGQPFNAYVMQYSIDRAIIMNSHTGPAWMIDEWIKGAQFTSNDMNQFMALSFLVQQSIMAVDASHLVFHLATPFTGFIQTLLNPVAFAVSPKAIIDNEPSQYTTGADGTFGMIPLTSFFPGIANATILNDLGLPSNYNIDNSGVVPQSDPGSPTGYTWLNTHSAGTGPYQLVDFTKGGQTDFSKNMNWWNKADFQINTPEKIKITQVLSNTIRMADLKNGSTDFSDIPYNLLNNFGVNSSHLISNYTGVNFYTYTSLESQFIGMNMNNSLPIGQVVEFANSSFSQASDNYTRLLKYSWKNSNGLSQLASPDNPFSALLFREAFAYVFPTQTLIDQALLGFGIRMQGAIPKGLFGYDAQLIANGNIPTQNLTTAKALFDQVGWKGTILFSYESNSTVGIITASLLQSVLENLSVGISIVPNEIAIGNGLNNILNGSSVLFEEGFSPIFADPQEFVSTYYQSNNFYAPAINYNNTFVDALIDSGKSSSGPIFRSNIYHQIEINASGDFPYIYLYQPWKVFLVRDWVNGITEPSSDSLNPMVDFFQVQFLSKGDIVGTSGELPKASSSVTNTSNLFSIGTIQLLIASTILVPVLVIVLALEYRKIRKRPDRTIPSSRKQTKNVPASLSTETLEKLDEMLVEINEKKD